MFFTGLAGYEKTRVLSWHKKCHTFCQIACLPFGDRAFYLILSTGSLAWLLRGTTIHSAAHLAKYCITDALCKDWKHVEILVINEVSFLSDSNMETLDKICTNQLNKTQVLCGGISILFPETFANWHSSCQHKCSMLNLSCSFFCWK